MAAVCAEVVAARGGKGGAEVGGSDAGDRLSERSCVIACEADLSSTMSRFRGGGSGGVGICGAGGEGVWWRCLCPGASRPRERDRSSLPSGGVTGEGFESVSGCSCSAASGGVSDRSAG